MKRDFILYILAVFVFICVIFIYIDNTKQITDALDKHSKMFTDSLKIEINALKDERIKLQKSIDSLQKTIDVSEADLKQRIKKLRDGK